MAAAENRSRIPLFPLGTVLFPGLVLPMHVFEPRYRALVSDLLGFGEDGIREFGVVAIKRGWEVGSPTGESDENPPDGTLTAGDTLSLYEIGCTAEIRQITELPDGRYDLVTVGRRRFRLLNVDQDATPYLTGEVEWLTDPPADPDNTDDSADDLAANVLAAFQHYLRLMRRDDDSTGEQLPGDPTVLSHLVAATASLTLEDRQRLLAEPDTVSRLRAERTLLRRESALLRQVRAIPVSLGDLAVPASPN